MIPPLSARVLDTKMESLSGWTLEPSRSAIQKSFIFTDFVEAFGFMARVALHAERADHHPEWSNIYDRVSVRLTTHDVGGVSDRDFALAALIDQEAVRGRRGDLAQDA